MDGSPLERYTHKEFFIKSDGPLRTSKNIYRHVILERGSVVCFRENREVFCQVT